MVASLVKVMTEQDLEKKVEELLNNLVWQGLQGYEVTKQVQSFQSSRGSLT